MLRKLLMPIMKCELDGRFAEDDPFLKL
jgi:hypothetical protein